MKCKKCGAKTTIEDNFCPECGEKLSVAQKNSGYIAKQYIIKHPKLAFSVIAVIIIIILCAIFKYKALLPVIMVLVVIVAIIVNRKLLGIRKHKSSQEVAQCILTDNDINRFSQYFVNREEKYVSSLGNGYIMNYLASGNLSKGFAVISNKRVYFRGSCFSGQGKALIKTDEERTVDIKDVTGSGFIYRRYLGILLGLLAALAVMLTSFGCSVLGIVSGWENIENYQTKADKVKATIAKIDDSEKVILVIKEEIEENNKLIEKLENKLSEKEMLQFQIYLENTGNIPFEEFLYNTEINYAYEEYLCQLDDIFYNSEMYRLLCDLYGKAYWFDSLFYFDIGVTEEAFAALCNHDYYDYLNGNNMLSYHTYNGELAYYDSMIWYVSSLGVRYEVIALAYRSIDLYDDDEILDLYWEIIDSSHEDVLTDIQSRLNNGEEEAFQAAYREFIEKVAPSYAGSETRLSLAQIVTDYIKTHPDAPFADKIEIPVIPTEYDTEIGELRTEIQELKDSNEKSKSEIAELRSLQYEQSDYERRYKEAQKETSKAFTITSLVTVAAGLLVTFLISCFLVFLDYFKKRKTMFQIQYAGGSIAFNVSYYAKAEIDDFQKQLRRTKDLAEESAAKVTVTEPSVQPTAQSSISDELRKYSDLLKEGLISQEEFDIMKKNLLGL